MVFIWLTFVLMHLHLVSVGRHSDGSREGTWWRGRGKESVGGSSSGRNIACHPLGGKVNWVKC